MTPGGPEPAPSTGVRSPNDERVGSVRGGRARGGVIVVGRRRLGLLHSFIAVLLALALAFVPPVPARAGSLLSCIEAAVPVDDLAKAADLTAALAGCSALAASNPVAAAVMATLVALAAAGELPTDADACKQAIDSVVGKVLAQALLDLLDGKVDANALNDVINGSKSISAIVDAIPGLGEFLNCGCDVIGAPATAAQIAGSYMNKVGDCLDFFGDIGGAFLDVLEAIGCGIASLFGDCGDDNNQYSPVYCPGSTDLDCWIPDVCTTTNQNIVGDQCDLIGYSCVPPTVEQQIGGLFPGQAWTDNAPSYVPVYNCCSCSNVPHAIATSTPGVCACEPPYTPKYDNVYFNGQKMSKWLMSCDCKGGLTQLENGQCYCARERQLKDGKCVPCLKTDRYVPEQHKCEACPPGEVGWATQFKTGFENAPTEWHYGCKVACDPTKGEYFDGSECKQCTATTYVVYDTEPGGLGHCADCPAGQRSDVDHKYCGFPLCSDDQNFDPVLKICKGCPSGQIPVHPDEHSSLGACVACPQGLVSMVANKQAFCTCPRGTQMQVEGALGAVGVKYSCVPRIPELTQPQVPLGICPASLIRVDDKCMCPRDTHLEDGKCVPGRAGSPLKATVPPSLRKDCSTLGPNFINNPKNLAACIRCPAGRVADAARTACVRLPVAPREPTVRTLKPALQCPPRTAPNAAGTACIPLLDMPDFGAPGSLAPAGRGMPSAPTRR